MITMTITCINMFIW